MEDFIYEDIKVIERMKDAGVFKNYIEYIVFPFYKNLRPQTRINLDFPLTVLIGKNGAGKSSTLHAFFGAPLGYTCSDFWFSTDVDPILESGDRNRFYYGYSENKKTEIKEVMKMRMKRGSETKKEDLDYWETSKPIKKDGMKSNIRYSPVKKDVVYLDFRAEVSAFDKIFHFSKDGLVERKELLRSRAKYLKRLFDEEPMRFKGTQDEKVGKLEILSKPLVTIIGDILGKEYLDIRVAEHKLYRNYGTSVYMKTKQNSGYSEANAGSGEIAVVQLVRRIEKTSDYSLVLLDEPEVSLHPGAQEKLKKYLLDVIKRKKIQIIISSHSTSLISGLPNSAIKLFRADNYGKFYVEEDVNYREAFYDIEYKVRNKKIIYCEDYAAQTLIIKMLRKMNKLQYFDVLFCHGGEKNLVNHYMTAIATNKDLLSKVFFVLDGDMNNDYVFDENSISQSDLNNSDFLRECILEAFGRDLTVYPDEGNGGKRKDQVCEDYLSYLRYYNSNVFFLPQKKIPEELILSSKLVNERFGKIIKKYGVIDKGNAKDVVEDISEFEHGDRDSIKDTISMLSYKFCDEVGDAQNEMKYILNAIFEK